MINDRIISLNCLSLGQIGTVSTLVSEGVARRRMLDLGLIKGTHVKPLQISPSGDPTAYHIRGTVIALRSEEANNIMVEI